MGAQKSFKNEIDEMNPALRFISTPEEQEPTPDPEPQPMPQDDSEPDGPGYKLNPEYIQKWIEKRTRRVQLLLQPSLYKSIKKIAMASGRSVNDVMHEMLEESVKRRGF